MRRIAASTHEPFRPGPPPGTLFFSPEGRGFAENRYLCIMSIVRNTESDLEFENKIRPQELETFSGQDKIVDNLHIFIKAALMRGDSLDHVLLHGPRDWARRRWRTSSPTKWGRSCASRRVPCSTSRATWRAC